MSQILEVLMLVLYGLSWPFNILKSIRSRTAKGKTLTFHFFIIVGYICGLGSKFVSGNMSYVVYFYIVDIVLVTTDLILTIRNIRLDKVRDREAKAA